MVMVGAVAGVGCFSCIPYAAIATEVPSSYVVVSEIKMSLTSLLRRFTLSAELAAFPDSSFFGSKMSPRSSFFYDLSPFHL